jgi:hypothetical protein
MKRDDGYEKKNQHKKQKPMVRNNERVKQKQQRKPQQVVVEHGELVVVVVVATVTAMEVLLLGRYLMIRMAQHRIWIQTQIRLTIATQELHLNLPRQPHA